MGPGALVALTGPGTNDIDRSYAVANINSILRDANISLVDWREARHVWRAYRVANGWAPIAPLLTSPPKPGASKSPNLKLAKDKSVVTVGLALAQANTVGRVTLPDGSVMSLNTCPFSTPACRHGCVSQNGNGRYDRVQEARKLKTRFLMEHPSEFVSLLAHEIDVFRARYGRKLRVRLNTFSDVRWEEVAPWLLRSGGRRFVRFYDYTKDWHRNAPANYCLCLSASERTRDTAVAAAVASGRNVAVVFSTARTAPLPAFWEGLAVVDGDESDNRADDPRGVVVGLRAKGRMRGDTRGMVRSA